MKYGFIADDIQPDHYTFGAELNVLSIQPNGNWSQYLPAFEAQNRNGLETMNCTSYGTLNCIEILMRKLFNLPADYSDRFIGILAGTTVYGNSPHTVAEAIRKTGLIDEGLLPFGDIDNWNDYYSPYPLPKNLIKEAGKWLRQYEFNHDWVFVNVEQSRKPELLMLALKSSPIGVSVNAWHEKGGMFYKPKGSQDNHWCTLYGYDEGKYWLVYDHYEAQTKRLVWDYDFSFAKRFIIKKRESKPSWTQNIITRLKDFCLWFF